MNKHKSLGATIKQSRIRKNMSQEQLAELMNISLTHMKHIESDNRSPSIDLLFKLADKLNFSLDAVVIEGLPGHDPADTVCQEINYLLKYCSLDELQAIHAGLQVLVDSKNKG